jgi:hypothetical protein
MLNKAQGIARSPIQPNNNKPSRVRRLKQSDRHGRETPHKGCTKIDRRVQKWDEPELQFMMELERPAFPPSPSEEPESPEHGKQNASSVAVGHE